MNTYDDRVYGTPATKGHRAVLGDTPTGSSNRGKKTQLKIARAKDLSSRCVAPQPSFLWQYASVNSVKYDG